MVTLFLLAGFGVLLALVLGAIVFNIFIGLILFPIKLGFMLFKGLLVGFMALPLLAAGFALFIGLVTVAGVFGVAALILSRIF